VQLASVRAWPDDEGAVPHHQSSERFERDAWTGPGRRIAGRNLAGIGEARYQPGAGLAVEHRHFMSGAGQVYA